MWPETPGASGLPVSLEIGLPRQAARARLLAAVDQLAGEPHARDFKPPGRHAPCTGASVSAAVRDDKTSEGPGAEA